VEDEDVDPPSGSGDGLELLAGAVFRAIVDDDDLLPEGHRPDSIDDGLDRVDLVVDGDHDGQEELLGRDRLPRGGRGGGHSSLYRQ
jgi:hypothetical protein